MELVVQILKVICEGQQPERRKGTAETSASNNKRAYLEMQVSWIGIKMAQIE